MCISYPRKSAVFAVNSRALCHCTLLFCPLFQFSYVRWDAHLHAEPPGLDKTCVLFRAFIRKTQFWFLAPFGWHLPHGSFQEICSTIACRVRISVILPVGKGCSTGKGIFDKEAGLTLVVGSCHFQIIAVNGKAAIPDLFQQIVSVQHVNFHWVDSRA